MQNIIPPGIGLVKVENEEWRARSEQVIEKDEIVIVTEIRGVTLTVEKLEGGK